MLSEILILIFLLRSSVSYSKFPSGSKYLRGLFKATGNYFVQIGEFHARVDFHRGKPAMAQQLLDLTDVGTAFQ